jgi:hypothetical protein
VTEVILLTERKIMIAQINATVGHDFGVFCPKEDYVEKEVEVKGKIRKKKVPAFLAGIALRMRIIEVKYRQTHTKANYEAPSDVLYTGPDLKNHEGVLVRYDVAKSSGLPYLTILDRTRKKIVPVNGNLVKLEDQHRSVRQETLSFLEVNGSVVIKNGKLIENPKPSLKFIMRLAWELRKDHNLDMGIALKIAWSRCRVIAE